MREDILYTPEEIAKRLKLSKYTVYEMIKRGEIPAHRIGRSLRISDKQYDAYLTESRQAENTFEAEISVNEDGEKIATVKGVSGTVDIVVSTELEGSVRLGLKPEEIILSRSALDCSARNNIEGTIIGMEENAIGYRIVVNIGIPLIVTVTKRSVDLLNLQLGDPIFVVFKAMSVIVV